jgi:hypothetical protein
MDEVCATCVQQNAAHMTMVVRQMMLQSGLVLVRTGKGAAGSLLCCSVRYCMQ